MLDCSAHTVSTGKQAAELRKMATASGGDNVTLLVKKKHGSIVALSMLAC